MQEEARILLEKQILELKPMVVAQGKQDEPGIFNDLGESPKKGLFVGADFNDPKSSNNPYFDPQAF